MDGQKIKVVYKKPTDLIGAEYNPRQITDKQFNDLCDSIKRFGFKDPIIVNINEDRKNIIIAGHQRKRVAEHLGLKEVPCVEVDYNLEQEKEFNIRHNLNGGSFDMDMLANDYEIDWLKDVGFEEWQVGYDVGDIDFDEKEEEEKEDKPIKLTVKIDYSSEGDEFLNELKDWLKAYPNVTIK